MIESPFKRCSACGEEFPATPEFFHLMKTGKYGLVGECKSCRCKKNRDYQSRPEIKERQRIRMQIFWKVPENQDRRRTRSQLPSYRQKKRINRIARKIRERQVLGSHNAEQIQGQLKRQKYRCYYAACGHSKFKKSRGKYVFEIEHTFPLSRVAGSDVPANDIGYLVLSCHDCNVSKGNRYPWEWPEGGRLL